MDTPPDSSGLRLRWWQEDAPPVQKWYSEPAQEPIQTAAPAAAASETLNFEEELEAEALRRSSLERDAIVLQGTYASVMPKIRRQLAWLFVPIALMNLIIGILGQSWVNILIPLVFVAEYFFIAAILRKQFDQHPPQIVMSSLGLTVDMQHYRVGPIFWDEIKSVRVVNWGFYKSVTVKLKNPDTLKRALIVRPGPAAWLIRLSLNKNQIDIMDQCLPLSAQEIAAKIATFNPATVRDSR